MALGERHGRTAIVAVACPLQPGQPCTLCHKDAYLGPQDCPTVAMVMNDPDLRAELATFRAEYRERTTS